MRISSIQENEKGRKGNFDEKGEYFGGGLIYMMCTPMFPPAPSLCNHWKNRPYTKDQNTTPKQAEECFIYDKRQQSTCLEVHHIRCNQHFFIYDKLSLIKSLYLSLAKLITPRQHQEPRPNKETKQPPRGAKGTLMQYWWECELILPLWKMGWRFF